jgi:hypothetical protein
MPDQTAQVRTSPLRMPGIIYVGLYKDDYVGVLQVVIGGIYEHIFGEHQPKLVCFF